MSSVDTQTQLLPTSNSHKHVKHDSANTHLIGKKSSTSSVIMSKKSNNSLKDHHEKDRNNSNDKHKQKNKNHSREKSIPKRERLIPESDTILDLEELGNDDNPALRKALIPLITDMLPGWDVSDESDIQIERVSGALTNCVFFITKVKNLHGQVENKKPLRVLLRVYGNGVDQLCDRQKELNFLEMLSALKIGPKLLGIFKNGRFEQHLESKTLNNNDLRDPSTSRYIAQRLSQLHHIVNIYPPPQENIKPEVWVNIDKWYPLALNTISSKCTEEQKKILKGFDLKLLKDEIETLKIKLEENINSPIVFAHNDTQYGNILRLTDGSLVVVDFEYSGYNYQAFDIANHFCEMMYDYRSSDPHKMKLDLYPNEDQQIDFLRSYLNTERCYLISTINNASLPSLSPPIRTDDQNLQKLMTDVRAFTLASHVMWGLWGLIQSGQSQINFDYLSYGMERLRRFREIKEEIYEHLSSNKD